MKLNQLSVIFIIIILPMSLVLSTYIGNLVDVSNQLSQYDALILNATYDACKSFEMNDLNDKYNMQTLSLERNISGSVNSFFDSFANGLGQTGYTKEEIKTYVPVMLYTMYDGFYLYGPHESVTVRLNQDTTERSNEYISNEWFVPPDGSGGFYTTVYYQHNAWDGDVAVAYLDRDLQIQPIGDALSRTAYMKYTFARETLPEQQYGIKPYSYYTCRYVDGDPTSATGYDLTINYSLDNYIKIMGMWHGISICESGYLVNPDPRSITVSADGRTYTVNRTDISAETLTENIISKVTHNIGIERGPADNRTTTYISVVNEPNNVNVNGNDVPFDTTTHEYQYIVLNNQKYYLDNMIDDYNGYIEGTRTYNKFDYTYRGGDISRNMSFCDTYCGYPIFRLDESKNENKRVYVNRSEMQTIVDYLNNFPGNSFDTNNFYLLNTTNGNDDYTDSSGTIRSHTDTVNNIDLRATDVSRRIGNMSGWFTDINAWMYYRNALNFTRGGIAYKDVNGDNRIDDEDRWEGAATILDGITLDNVRSNIFNQNYKVISDGTGEVVETTENTDDADEYVSSHTLYFSDNDRHIFAFNDVDNDPELDDSVFNYHRMDVIIKTIEYNLVNSIANYKRFVTGSGINTDFDYQMPTLKEDEWSTLSSEISILSFIQGLPVKRYKYYTNYAIASSTKNNLYASKYSIFLTEGNDPNTNFYHDPRCSKLYTRTGDRTTEVRNTITGYANVDFNQDFMSGAFVGSSLDQLFNNGQTYFYYRQPAQADYDCAVLKGSSTLTIDNIITGGNVTMINDGNVTYNLDSDDSVRNRRAYIAALARRRYTLYTARNPDYSTVQTTR